MPDLFENAARKSQTSYSAKDIEVLEGLDPVRRRPGMYIGGTDEAALHHLAAEVLDNAMDEAVAGHASRIEVVLHADGSLEVLDNGRGIPVDEHPKFKGKSALEVILTTLHSGGKFSDTVYQTSGGLHGVGISVVNALSEWLVVTVARERELYEQSFARGRPTTPLVAKGAVQNRRGTTVRFLPDRDIFGADAAFVPARLYRMARSKAYLFRGVEIRWTCDPKHLRNDQRTPQQEVLHFPGGLEDFLAASLAARPTVTASAFSGRAATGNDGGRVEWAVAWPLDGDGFVSSYCNTVPTPQGGTHEAGFRTALARSLRGYGELVGNRRAQQITADDAMASACVLLSVFIPDPQFQGQTKDKLSSPSATRLVETAVKDHFDHWLANDRQAAGDLLEHAIERMEERLRRRAAREMARKTPTRRLRLPGKLADCTRDSADGTEVFLVEGDSAGGSAKQARDRETQAVLPLRGKILNVASASADKLAQNQELRDLVQALGCGCGSAYEDDKLRYERVIIMTDADVDGAHIASLLMTFFYREMPGLIENGRLFLAMPPLYRLTQGGHSVYARDEAHKDALMAQGIGGRGKIEISRFKGLGEMPPAQLRLTTMSPEHRTLFRVVLPDKRDPAQHGDARETARLIEALMGRKAEKRFSFIQENAAFVTDLDL